MPEGEHWLGPVLKYLVLPVAAIGILWYLVSSILFGDKAKQQAADIIAKLMSLYQQEYEDFSADGTIDATEAGILNAKLETMKPPIEAISNSILDPSRVLIESIAFVAMVSLSFATLWKLLKGDFKLGSKAKAFYDQWSSKIGKIEPSAESQIMLYGTAEELTMVSKLMTIYDLVDQGQTILASNLYQAEQSYYFVNVLPQMQASYNVLAAQLPYLMGVQLAFAQMMMTQYSIYLTYFVAIKQPIFIWMPPI